MLFRKTFVLVLGLYPAEFRAQFGSEMVTVFEQAIAQRRGRGDVSLFVSLLREILGLIAGAARERVKYPSSKSAAEDVTCPSDIAGAERYLQIVSGRLIAAIASHDSPMLVITTSRIARHAHCWRSCEPVPVDSGTPRQLS